MEAINFLTLMQQINEVQTIIVAPPFALAHEQYLRSTKGMVSRAGDTKVYNADWSNWEDGEEWLHLL